MLLQAHDKPKFKQWLLPKLAAISDAEPEVLAEYVVELFSASGPAAEVKSTCQESLVDFLDDHTTAFVDEVANAIARKTWKQQGTAEKQKPVEANSRTNNARLGGPTGTNLGVSRASSSSTLAADAPEFHPQRIESLGDSPRIPTAPRADLEKASRQASKNALNARNNQSKKRKQRDREMSEPLNGQTDVAMETVGPAKRPRNSTTRRGRGDLQSRITHVDPAATNNQRAPANPTQPPANQFAGAQPTPIFSPLDAFSPSDAMNMFSAMMNMVMNMNMPGMPLPFPAQPFDALPQSAPNSTCPDYETKGVCVMGTLCPFEHGAAIVVSAAPEYDPNHSALAMQPHVIPGHHSTFQRRERPRAPFSHFGPSHNARNDTVVVDQIPHDYFSEQHVRDYFSQFGSIADVQIQHYKRLAIVKFEDHYAARNAYESPKVIFDNRFVKVYWYKPEQLPQRNGTSNAAIKFEDDDISAIYKEDEEMIDMEAFKKHQAELQQEFEDRRRRAEEVAAQSDKLNMELLAKEEELNELREKVLAKARAKGVAAINRREEQAALIGTSRIRNLAKLQAEAEGLFANSGMGSETSDGYGRDSSNRSGYRGRGGHVGVVRLDNRPRRLAVAGMKPGSDRERALKQHLLNSQGCNSVQPHATRANTLIVGFEQRFQAEIFLKHSSSIPNVGDLMLSWVPNDASVAQQPGHMERMSTMLDESDEESSVAEYEEEPQEEIDLDVADDTDQWL